MHICLRQYENSVYIKKTILCVVCPLVVSTSRSHFENVILVLAAVSRQSATCNVCMINSHIAEIQTSALILD